MAQTQQVINVLPPTPDIESYRDVWIFIEVLKGKMLSYCLEGISAARKIASKVNMNVGALVASDTVSDDIVKTLIEHGADYVVVVEHPYLADYEPFAYTLALEEVVRERKPWALIFMADELGRDLAPRLAYRLVTGLATDNIDFDVEDFYHGLLKERYTNILAQIRPDFATRIAKIYTPRHRPQIASLRPGSFKPLPRDPGRKGEVYRYKPSLTGYPRKVKVLGYETIEDRGADLLEAKLIVSLGLGILRDAEGNPKNPLEAVDHANKIIELVRNRLGVKAAMGASRALIHADVKELRGIITHDIQVGQTGKTVSPKVYIAAGISGAIQHRVGILRAENILSINIDPRAPIHEIAHYVIIDDLYRALPKLYEALRRKIEGG
ncbi:MAG: electron transfer flavoprotein subunit alpha/FixB family protein [Desulfurococcales archaeon]|jgi:electron transfer flavoprotein alpha subunit|nr:electron transfer flavoprotein subunit alpha/FixB family protein [Desulfurococcales archaeon]